MQQNTFSRPGAIRPARREGGKTIELQSGSIDALHFFALSHPGYAGWVVNKDLLRSRSKNTPFDEAKMQGRVLRTVVAGETVFEYAGVERT